MSSTRMEQVFYNCHSKVSNYVLLHTSHKLRSFIEHVVLGLAVSAFCVVILSHRSFVHREDIASISRSEAYYGWLTSSPSSCHATNDTTATSAYNESSINNGYLGFIGEGRGVSMYSIIMQIIWSGYAFMVKSKQQPPPMSNNNNPFIMGKKIPVSCLKSIPGFRQDADVNHILLQYEDKSNNNVDGKIQQATTSSRAFTTTRGEQANEQVISGMPTNSTQQLHSCIIGTSTEVSRQRGAFFGFAHDNQQLQTCPHEMISFLDRHGYLSIQQYNDTLSKSSDDIQNEQYSPIVYSYSHSQGLLRLPPTLQYTHNVSTQFIIASSTDPNCFGDPLAQNIIFRLVGPDTPILNWILGMPLHQQHQNAHAIARPRFVYHWKTRKELDLDLFDMDRYAFSSKSSDHRSSGAYELNMQPTTTTTSSLPMLPLTSSINKVITRVQKYPLYRFLRFLTFKLLVLLSTLLIFFLTTSLVSFTFQETQDRMLEFTLQLQTRVRAQMPLGGLILGHVLENLVFVPIMIGMIFFLIEFYGGDKFLAFNVLSMVWICEVFSAISIRSAQGMHFFPRVFFLYFTLFHVYFFSCPIGFTYASLASTIMFLFHTMIFFWNRYELPALHAGFITSQNPRMMRWGMDGGGREERVGHNTVNIVSPPRIQPVSLPTVPNMRRTLQPPQMPHASTSDDDQRSNFTAPTAPLSSTIDFTPNSEQQNILHPPYSGPMRSYVAAASTSLQSIRSLASIQSLSSLAGADRTSPNLIFHGGYGFTDSVGGGDADSEEDSYIARVSSPRRQSHTRE